MAILVPRTPSPLQYATETIREPGTRDLGVSNAVPQMIREAAPLSGISAAGSGPRLTTRTGTSQSTNINPLVGAALGALVANIISERSKSTTPKTPAEPKKPIDTQPKKPIDTGPKKPIDTGPKKPIDTGPKKPIDIENGDKVGIITENDDGTITQTMDDGSTITTDSDGNVVSTTEATDDPWSYDPDSGTFYNSETGTFWDPETGTEEFGLPPETIYDGNYSYDYGYDYSNENLDNIDPGYSYDYGYDIDPGYSYDFGYDIDPGYSYDYGYDYSLPDFGNIVSNWDQYVSPIDWGTGIDFGSYDYGSFFKKGGMATPMMKKGGVIKMSDGGDLNYSYDLYGYGDPMVTTGDLGYSYDLYDYGQGIQTSSDAEAQPGGFYGNTGTTYTNPVTGEVFRDGIKIYDPNAITSNLSVNFRDILGDIGNTASGALSTIQDFISNNPKTSGALAGALLAQVLSNTGGTGGRENLGVDMTKYGVIPPRTTAFGVGAPRFLTYQQYGTPPRMPEMYGAELYRNLNAPGFNPVNPTPAPQQQMARGGLACMADGGSTYYTYGTPVNPADNLAKGGQPMMGGGTPMVAGRIDYRHGSAVEGPGDGQSDDIPAMLADGEYVIDAETVAMLGNGSNKAGAKKLDEFRMNIRKHKRDTPLDKIPPASKSPLAYLKGAKNG